MSAKRKPNKRRALKSLKKKADKALSDYVRAVTVGEFGCCPLCFKDATSEQTESGRPVQACFHFLRARMCPALRWDIRNVVGSCHRCNYLEYRNPDPSRAWYIRRHGVEQYLALVDESSKPFKPTPEYLQEVVKTFQQKLKAYKENQPQWPTKTGLEST